VLLSQNDIQQLAGFKRLSEFDFIQRYTRLSRNRRGLALKDKENGECIFLDGADCSVQPVKPQQCKDFPNLWNFPGFDQVCQAIPREVNELEFERLTRPTQPAGNRNG
jgi:Fe-S-cluster containining protein